MIKIVLTLTLQFALFSCHAISEPENAFPALESSWKGQGDEEVDVIGDLTIYRYVQRLVQNNFLKIHCVVVV